MKTYVVSTHNICFHGEIRKVPILFNWKKELYLQLCDDNDDFGFDDRDDVCADPVTKEQRNVIFLRKFC